MAKERYVYKELFVIKHVFDAETDFEHMVLQNSASASMIEEIVSLFFSAGKDAVVNSDRVKYLRTRSLPGHKRAAPDAMTKVILINDNLYDLNIRDVRTKLVKSSCKRPSLNDVHTMKQMKPGDSFMFAFYCSADRKLYCTDPVSRINTYNDYFNV